MSSGPPSADIPDFRVADVRVADSTGLDWRPAVTRRCLALLCMPLAFGVMVPALSDWIHWPTLARVLPGIDDRGLPFTCLIVKLIRGLLLCPKLVRMGLGVKCFQFRLNWFAGLSH